MANITIQVDSQGQSEVITTTQSSVSVQVTYTPSISIGGDATVENTDSSYSATVAPEQTHVIPDITLTKNDNTTVSAVAAIDLDLGVIDPFPATWAELVAEYGQGYAYPVESQTTSYRIGDAASIESSTFSAARIADKLKVFNTLASFLVLNNNNTFGNTNRYTDSVGGQDYDGTDGSLVDYIIDHFTGLGWFRVQLSAAIWETQIDAGLSATSAGFSDWFLSSIAQIISIHNLSIATNGINYSPFDLGLNNVAGHSSTISEVNNTRSAIYTFDSSPTNIGIEILNSFRSSARIGVICRKHY